MKKVSPVRHSLPAHYAFRGEGSGGMAPLWLPDA